MRTDERSESGGRCPGEDDIAAFVRAGPAHPGGHALEAHVAQCAACRRLVSALARAAGSRPSVDSVSPTLPVDATASEAQLPLGARFGRYVVVDWLGTGGMGVVYAARDPELDRKVALKVLALDGAGSAQREIRDLLLREAQAMAQLAHPNVVTVFDVGTVEDRGFIAMELVEGVTLAKWLRAERREPAEIIAVFVAAGHGLAAAHAAGLIHRDFKPDNVLIGNDGRVRVTDFGLARVAPGRLGAQRDPVEARGDAPHTGLAGTPAYMAPEQVRGQSVDARADQFSFAVSLYEALHGERPFDPRLDPRLGPPLDPPHRPARAHRKVLSRALSADPDDRYPSMIELLAALAPRSRRSRATALIALAGMAAAIAIAGGYALHLRAAAEQRIELASRLRGLAPEMRMTLRNAHMLPLHDIRAARERVRGEMRNVERARQTPAGQDERALIDFVVGEGYRALGDHERALPLLEAAWSAGERGPHIDAALGHTLGAVYWRRLEHIEKTVPESRSAEQIRGVEKRFREPAMAHLRAALAAGGGSPVYLEALIAFYERRFADASRSAHAAFAESPTFYEAGMLEARAQHQAARELMAANRTAEATAGFARAVQIYKRVLDIARSDGEAWLGYGAMIYAQAVALTPGDLPADLRQSAIGALHAARQIDPDRPEPVFLEAEIHEHDANVAIIEYRDPSQPIAKAIALANAARDLGGDADEVDVFTCILHWERAAYQGTHGVDPRPVLDQAIAACERALATRPDADRYASLGIVYDSLAAYEGAHGTDPMGHFELADRNLRLAIGIEDNANLQYSVGRVWTRVANYQAHHGQDPERAVDTALTALQAAVRMDARRADAWAAMSDALIARVRFQHAERRPAHDAVTQAHAAIERALAIEPEQLPAIKYRILLAELDAEWRLSHGGDPTPAVARMRATTQLWLRRLPDDGFGHGAACRADVLAARWGLRRDHRVDRQVDRELARAAAAAARARAIDAMDALAWTASAEVELLRAEAARASGSAVEATLRSALAFNRTALAIDPKLVRASRVRDELARRAALATAARPPGANRR